MNQVPEVKARNEVRDGMRITWHQPIEMDDGIVLRADVFQPIEEGRYPVILTYGVYAKGLSYQEGYPHQWGKMVADHPEILEGSTNKYQNWEVTDPERWVPHGYVVIRVDSRGAGWSPGFLQVNSPRELDDLYQCIEWAGTREWSNGKVGMLGISYYSRNQWNVAVRNPPHLTAIIPWEGGNDRYRDSSYHGGILSQFQEIWAKHQVVNVQYGRGEKATQESQHRGVGGRTHHAFRRGAGRQPDQRVRGAKAASPRRRVAPPALGRSHQGHDPLSLLRQLGRAGDPSAGQLQRVHRGARQTEVARGPRRFPLVALLQRLRPEPAEAVLRPFPQGDRQRLGEDPAGDAQYPPPR